MKNDVRKASTDGTLFVEQFSQHLKAAGKSASTIEQYLYQVRRFQKHAGEVRLDRISEDSARSYFAGIKNARARSEAATVVSQFLNFSASRLPVPIARGAESPRAAAPHKKDLALRQQWNVEKIREAKRENDELIARLGRKVIDHYLFFQNLLKDGDVDLDAVARFADECRELIESNLPLFMSLSAQGLNVHSKIDERVQP